MLAADSSPFQREQNLYELELLAADGAIGRIAGMHFDPLSWAVRYLSLSNEELLSMVSLDLGSALEG